MGAMGGSFNTREYFHGRSTGFLRAIKPSFLTLAFVLPLLLLAAGPFTPGLLGLVFILQYLGCWQNAGFFSRRPTIRRTFIINASDAMNVRPM